jgi:hypothetical protein
MQRGASPPTLNLERGKGVNRSGSRQSKPDRSGD